MIRSGNTVMFRVTENDIVIDDIVGANLPNIGLATMEIPTGLGVINRPSGLYLEGMEYSLTARSGAHQIEAMKRPGELQHVISFVRDYVDRRGITIPAGTKAFLTGLFKSAASIPVKLNEAPEIEMTFEALRYRLLHEGRETMLIDKIAEIWRVDGVDYVAPYRNKLI